MFVKLYQKSRNSFNNNQRNAKTNQPLQIVGNKTLGSLSSKTNKTTRNKLTNVKRHHCARGHIDSSNDYLRFFLLTTLPAVGAIPRRLTCLFFQVLLDIYISSNCKCLQWPTCMYINSYICIYIYVCM